jgi:hypothetical protein
MNYLKTSLYTYQEYIKDYKTNRLDKNNKLHISNIPNNLKIDEIFDSNINMVKDIDFEIIKYKHIVYENEYNYKFIFKTNKSEYRLDFIILIENNKNINNDILKNKKYVSVSFSEENVNSEDYDTPTNNEEQYEVLNKVIYLVNYFKNMISDRYIFMFGDPNNNSKINIYKYILEKCFPNYRIIKDFTSGFPKTDIGFYLVK